jgi:hypothetical protein
MATRPLWRTRGKLAVAANVASSEDPETALKLCTAVPVRLYLDTVTAQTPSIASGMHVFKLKFSFLHRRSTETRFTL